MPKMIRLTCLLLVLCAIPATALAQLPAYRVDKRATGERYNLELAVGLWNPTPDIRISSSQLSIIGTEIDAVTDLGIAQKKLPDLQIVLRPATKHKLRFEYIPVQYSAETVLTRAITFRGVSYSLGLPVNSSLDWKQYRFGYEYDALYRDRGFVGIIGEVKYTNVQATVASPLASASTQQRVPIPAIGGIARGYLTDNVSVTGEVTAFKLPEKVAAQSGDVTRRGRYVDFDLYGTVNFSNNVGVQGGYRSLDAQYVVDQNSGNLTLKGLYFRGVVRF